jgi:DNA-binding helix-hairpin-helix protein with protein kinase domain
VTEPEPVPETRPPDVAVQPVEADRELGHRNNVFGLALLGLFLLLFGGTFVIAFIYLAVD